MKLDRFKKISVYTLLVVIIVASLAVDYSFAQDEDYYKQPQRFNTVLLKVNENYVEDVKLKDLGDAAIDGMLKILDPHTSYLYEDDYAELMIHTTAEFGGLGITISIRDNILTVVSPLPGTPAYSMGIIAGDKILKIEGKSTAGITVDEAVKKLRGKPGTNVTISVGREGENAPIEYTITRAVIHVKSVPYSGFINDSIGYIRLVQFSKESGNEVENALKKLEQKKLAGCILDLRNNPGGLLTAAIDVAGKFIEKDKLVVFTKGRMRGQNAEYKTTGSSYILDAKIPLIVLVNEGSASASEIVAGAIQDWDRGVIMGRTSYGKGSVQTVIPLGLEKDFMKITTAYYYTPCGRCINKPSNGNKLKNHRLQDSNDEEDTDSTAKDSLTKVGTVKDSTTDTTKAKKPYYTAAKRIVYGGGGITPDIELTNQKWARIEEALERKTLFFKYAIKKLAELKQAKVKVDENFTISDSMLANFKKFADSTKIDYQTYSERSLKELEKVFELEYGDSAAHSAKKETIKDVDALFEKIKDKIKLEKEEDFYRSKDYIKNALKREFIGGAKGDEAQFGFALTYDNQVIEAVKLIKDTKKYDSIFIPVKEVKKEVVAPEIKKEKAK